MRESNTDTASYVVSEITSAKSLLHRGRRDPEKVDSFLEMLGDCRLQSAICECREIDTRIHRALCAIVSAHQYETKQIDWDGAEATWSDVKERLGLFARQEGDQKLTEI